jgi:hypothetical protein
MQVARRLRFVERGCTPGSPRGARPSLRADRHRIHFELHRRQRESGHSEQCLSRRPVTPQFGDLSTELSQFVQIVADDESTQYRDIGVSEAHRRQRLEQSVLFALERNQWTEVAYQVRPVARGETEFGAAEVRLFSPLGL